MLVRLAGLVGLLATAVLLCNDPSAVSLPSEPSAPQSQEQGKQPSPPASDRVEGEIVSVWGAKSPDVEDMLLRLASARERLRGTGDYAATFTQQVRKHGALLKPQEIALKVRHSPFSVYMKWKRDGQEALYVEGENDNKLVVHRTRGLTRLRKVWEIPPDSHWALLESRYPVTELGLLNLVKQILDIHAVYAVKAACVTETAREGERPVTRYTLTYQSRDEHPDFSKTVLCLSDDTHFPIRIENYEWREDGSPGELVESYVYTDLCLECADESDFDRNNEAYSFE